MRDGELEIHIKRSSEELRKLIGALNTVLNTQPDRQPYYIARPPDHPLGMLVFLHQVGFDDNDPARRMQGSLKVLNDGDCCILKVIPDDYGAWDKLYQTMQNYSWLDEQPITSNGPQPELWHGNGRRPKTRAEKIAAIEAWDALPDRRGLAEWLETHFGLAINGDLSVAESTFYGWRKLKKPWQNS